MSDYTWLTLAFVVICSPVIVSLSCLFVALTLIHYKKKDDEKK